MRTGWQRSRASGAGQGFSWQRVLRSMTGETERLASDPSRGTALGLGPVGERRRFLG